MFWFVMGLPTRFSAWCEAVVAEFAGGGLGPARVVAANTLDQFAMRVMQAGVSHGVIFSPQPASALRDALTGAGRPYIVALGDPQTALLEMVLGQGAQLSDAVQTIAGSCAAFAGDIGGSGALVLDPIRDMGDPAATAAAIAMHFGFPASENQLARFAARHTDAVGPVREDAARWWNNLGLIEQHVVTGALSAFTQRGPVQGSMSLTWHHQLFFRGDRAGERVSGPVDITGRAHCLIEGPFILLPPGTWVLSLSLLFSREAAEREFLVEVYTTHQLASGNMRPMHEGASVVHLEFTVDQSAQHPVNIRVSSLRAAFDGNIAVEAATLVRLPSDPQR
jgi:hypothetical protein